MCRHCCTRQATDSANSADALHMGDQFHRRRFRCWTLYEDVVVLCRYRSCWPCEERSRSIVDVVFAYVQSYLEIVTVLRRERCLFVRRRCTFHRRCFSFAPIPSNILGLIGRRLCGLAGDTVDTCLSLSRFVAAFLERLR